jgi:putative ABC transport system permease protein
MMMAVMERTRELGTIRAMGATPTQVVQLILLEAAVLGLLGASLGIAIGAASAELITWAEWMMPTPPGSTQDYPIRILILTDILWQTFILGFLIAVFSSAYPAYKAARLPVANALRFT